MAWTGSAEDRQLIRELIEAYSDAVTQRDKDAWAATWADKSTWTLPHMGEGFGGIEGKEAIVAAWVEGMAMFPFVQMNGVPGKIDIQGDRATVRSYTSEVAVKADGEEIRPRGQYDDVRVKQNGEWLFESRKFTVLHGE